jgi:hypothetical protein
VHDSGSGLQRNEKKKHPLVSCFTWRGQPGPGQGTTKTDLMVGENEGVCDHDILSPARRKDDDFGNVVGREGFDALVHGVGFGFVTVEADDREFLSKQTCQQMFLPVLCFSMFR